MAGPPGPREARPKGKLHDPAIQCNKLDAWSSRLWMGGESVSLARGARRGPPRKSWVK
jgi:hypothetical protein